MYIYIIRKIVHVCAALGIVVGGGGGGGGAAWKSRHTTAAWRMWKKSSVDSEGGGQGFPDPPGKSSQVIWGSIGNKTLDPFPGKSRTPPLTWKNVDPLRNLEKMIVFFEINHLTSAQ